VTTLVGVLGAGVMGSGVAHNLAQYGFPTLVIDVDTDQLRRCAAAIRRNLRLYNFHEAHKKAREPIDAVLGRIEFSTDLQRVAVADIVIENVTEDWFVKKEVYSQLTRICTPSTVFGINTSAIPISRIAALVEHPENVLGAHFMNPAPLKPMVEVIRGERTCGEALERFGALLTSLDKRFVVVNDSPGFVTNRAMMLFVNEAISILQEGVAQPEEIDTLFRECFGHKMGPLQTTDLIGLDTVLRSLEVLHERLGDPKFIPAQRLREMVNAGLLGMKSGHGFYPYE